MSRLKLGARFALILTGVFLVGIVLGGSVYWSA